jgi:hypothetical protein
MKRVAHYRERYLQEVFCSPWLALKRNGFYRDLRLKILRLALPQYFQWELEVLREEMRLRWHDRQCCFPYLNMVVELCPALPFGNPDHEDYALRLKRMRLKLHSFLPPKHVWRWVNEYATDL